MSEMFKEPRYCTYMYECSRNQDTGTKVLAEEEHLGRNLHPLDLLRNNWKSTSSDGCSEHNDYEKIRLSRIKLKLPTYTLQPREGGSRMWHHLPHSRIVASPW